MLLEVENLRHAYGDQVVVSGLSFEIGRGAIGCLLGPSGCGKTTVLRCIAGFEAVQEGEIRLSGKVVSRPGSSLPPEKRRIGMVFQDYALFPHLRIADNIAFGLHAAPAAERTLRRRARSARWRCGERRHASSLPVSEGAPDSTVPEQLPGADIILA